MMRLTHIDPCLTELDAWPADVDLICSAMEAARPMEAGQRRSASRRPHRVIARLLVAGEAEPVRVYTRDCDATHIGFVSERPLPMGFNATIEFAAPDGALMSAACTVMRCRECVPGWFEGALKFARAIPSLRLGA